MLVCVCVCVCVCVGGEGGWMGMADTGTCQDDAVVAGWLLNVQQQHAGVCVCVCVCVGGEAGWEWQIQGLAKTTR